MTDEVHAVLPDGTGPPARVPADIFAAAAGAFRSGRRVDMQSLARGLGVGRATLYRRAGNRESLLDEVVWWRGRRMVARQVLATSRLVGAERIAAVVAGAITAIESDEPLRTFMASEPDVALRILTSSRSIAGLGAATALANLIDLERARGQFDPDLDTSTLTYVIMHISAGFLYADIIGDGTPEAGQATTVVRALLTGLDRGHGAYLSARC